MAQLIPSMNWSSGSAAKKTESSNMDQAYYNREEQDERKNLERMTKTMERMTTHHSNKSEMPMDDESNPIVQVCAEPKPLKRAQKYLLCPEFHRADLSNSEQLAQLNGQMHVDGKARPREWKDGQEEDAPRFHLKFPHETHSGSELFFTHLVFVLPSGSDTIKNFAANLKKNKKLDLVMSLDALKAAFPNVSHLEDDKGHIIIKQINVKQEFAELPIEMTATLHSSSLNKKERMIGKTKQINRQNGSSNCSSMKSGGGVTHVVPKRVERTSQLDECVWHIADSDVHNSPDFFRWINVDADKAMRLLEDAKVKDKEDTIRFDAGPPGMQKAKDILQFLAVHCYSELCQLSRDVFSAEQPCLVEQDGVEKHQICYSAMKSVLQAHLHDFNQEEIMTNLKNLTLTLEPLRKHGSVGLHDLDKIVEEVTSSPSWTQFPSYFPSYCVTLEVAYTVCDHPFESGKKTAADTMLRRR